MDPFIIYYIAVSCNIPLIFHDIIRLRHSNFETSIIAR